MYNMTTDGGDPGGGRGGTGTLTGGRSLAAVINLVNVVVSWCDQLKLYGGGGTMEKSSL